MKKILFTAAVFSMMLAGCTSENDDYAKSNEPQKISFTAPVMSGITRAPYKEANGSGEIEGTYPAKEKFLVFGKRYKADSGYTNWADCLKEYNEGGEEAALVNAINGWDTQLSHFWIDGYKYAFGAVSPSKVPSATYTGAGVQVANFSPAAMGSQYDLMWAPRVYEKIALDKTGNDNNGNSPFNGVTLQFKHALSSIQFNIGVHPDNVKVDGQPVAEGIFKIKSIKIVGVDGTASFNENITNDAASGMAETPKWTENTGAETTYIFLDKSGSPVNIPAKSDQTELKKAMTSITDLAIGGNDAILIPQTLTSAAKIEVVWTSNGNEVALGNSAEDIIWHTTNIELNPGEWKIGYRYIYNLAFKRNKIYFNPTVEAWQAGGNSDHVIEK